MVAIKVEVKQTAFPSPILSEKRNITLQSEVFKINKTILFLLFLQMSAKCVTITIFELIDDVGYSYAMVT
jgi:hypothetical protein